MKLAHIDIDRPLILAPMENVTDPPFRRMCREYGADILYTEFVNCEALVRDVKRTLRKLQVTDSERPIAIQLYGSSPESLERAAAIAEEAGPDFIDLNAGCWVRKIANRGDGAGLLRDLSRFEAAVRAVVRGTRLPVTVKTRLGWDAASINVLEVARMVEQCGARMLAVHCRTRDQGYKGEADWSWLPRIKEVISIPLVGNGDVQCEHDAARMFGLGVDGVMIGRAAIHDAWIFERTRHFLNTGETLPEPPLRRRVELCLRHLRAAAEYKGERKAVLEHRKHYATYLKNVRYIAKLRAELMQLETITPIEERLWAYVADCEAEGEGG